MVNPVQSIAELYSVLKEQGMNQLWVLLMLRLLIFGRIIFGIFRVKLKIDYA